MRLRKEWGGFMPPYHWPRESRRIAWYQRRELEAYLPDPVTAPLPYSPSS